MKKEIEVLGTDIRVLNINKENYICLTDMIKNKDWDFFVSDWLRNRNTVEFLSIWEELHNENFNYGNCAIIKKNVWLNSYKISVKQWQKETNSIWLVSKAGRYWGTYAHKDIAFEFAMWISPKFKVYFIKEFQRLKEQEFEKLDWTAKRFLTKINYKIHTDSIKENLIPKKLSSKEISYIYADEADILNKALFGLTAKNWREQNLDKKGNIREYCNVEQLIVLANLESINSELIKMWLKQSNRLELLNNTAIRQMKLLEKNDEFKKID